MLNVKGGKNVGLTGQKGGGITRIKASDPRLADIVGKPAASNSFQVKSAGNILGLGLAVAPTTIDYAQGEISGAEYTGKTTRNVAGFGAGATVGMAIMMATPVGWGASAIGGLAFAGSTLTSYGFDYFFGESIEENVTDLANEL